MFTRTFDKLGAIAQCTRFDFSLERGREEREKQGRFEYAKRFRTFFIFYYRTNSNQDKGLPNTPFSHVRDFDGNYVMLQL